MRLFRRFLRLIAALLFVSLAGFVILLIAARMHDGPLGMIAGGALKSGELAIGAEPDWRFAHDLPTVELQLLEPARSRTTWILEVDGRIYIVSAYMNSMLGKLWKQWPPEAERDGRAVLRANGVRYERTLARIQSMPQNAPLIDHLVTELNRKYAARARAVDIANGTLWLFELAPRH